MTQLTKLSLLMFLFLLFAQMSIAQDNVYIPFREGQLWGYADTNGNIVVMPVYDRLVKQEKDMFCVKKGKEVGVVTLKNKVVIPFSDKTNISLKEDYILSYKTTYPDGVPTTNYSYYSIISGKKTFPTDITKAEELELHNEKYYRVYTRTGKQGLVKVRDNYEGIEKWYIDTSFVKIKNTWSLNYVLVEKDGIETKFSPGYSLEQIDSLEKIHYMTEIMEEEIGEYGEEEERPIWKTYSLFKTRIGKSYQLIVRRQWTDKNRQKHIIRDTLKEQYSKINILTKKKSFYKMDSLEYHLNHKKQESIAIVSDKDGKQGLVNSFGKLLVPFEYDSISTNVLLQKCKVVNLMARKNNKWGIVNLQNQTLLPFQYEQLLLDEVKAHQKQKIFLSCYLLKNGVIAIKNDKYGIVNSQGVVLPFQYDKVKYIRQTASFQLLKESKYGILQCERDSNIKEDSILIDPVFLYPVVGLAKISGYTVGLVLGERSRVKGYVDIKGFNYFID